jgi:hypothetical protein
VGIVPPKDVVVAAYAAANRGLYSAADAFVDSAVRKGLLRSHAATLVSGVRLRRTLLRLKGRRDEAAKRSRKRLRVFIRSNRALAQLRMGSPRFMIAVWNGFTRNRSLVRIEAARQVIRGERARVYLRLTFRDGSVVRDSEPTILRRGKWLLG